MLVIRFFRIGKKNQPSFKIVVTDKRKPTKAGRFVEEVGFWNPQRKEKVLKKERILYWISVGAKPSASVYNLLISEKIIEGKKIPVHKKAKKKEEKPAVAEAMAGKEEKSKEEKLVAATVPTTKKEKPVPEKVPESIPEKAPEAMEKKSETSPATEKKV